MNNTSDSLKAIQYAVFINIYVFIEFIQYSIEITTQGGLTERPTIKLNGSI